MTGVGVLGWILSGLALLFVPAADQWQLPDQARAAWAPGDPIFTPPTRTPPIVGVNYHGIWADASDSDRATMLDEFATAGVTWVRMDISWASLQPDAPGRYSDAGVAALKKRLDEIHARGLKTLVMFYWPPAWASGTGAKNGVPRDPQEYADAAAWLAGHFRGTLQAIELWNEPDLPDFLANTSVATYTNLLKAAYPKIKAANPDITVVAGSPTGINTDWYRQVYDLGGQGNFDALGIHPYIGSTDLPPTAWDPKQPQYYMRNIGTLVALMQANGDEDKQIWATEYGWSSHDDSFYGADVKPWKRGVSEQVQAQYLIQAQQVMAQWPQVRASFWYTDRNGDSGDPQEDNFGLLTRDLRPKPAWYAMRCAAGQVCGPSDGPPSVVW